MAVILGRNAASGASACWGALGFNLSATNTLLDHATCFLRRVYNVICPVINATPHATCSTASRQRD